MTTKWVKVNDLSNGQCSVELNRRFKPAMIRPDLCDYSDVYIVLKDTKDLLAAAAKENNKLHKDVAFKNNAQFRSCISKINNTLIDNAEDLDIVTLIYNLLEYSDNYSMTSKLMI